MSTPPSHIAYFITAHGFGHGVRSCVLINKIPSNIQISIVTGLPRSFFEREIHRSFDYINWQLDCGCIQKDALRVDKEATFMAYQAINDAREDFIEKGKVFFKSRGIDLVISDIAPLACRIAYEAGLPSIAVSNFTWADIYADYLTVLPQFKSLVEVMRSDYACANVYAWLSPGVSTTGFPLIRATGGMAREGKPRREALAKRWNLNPKKNWGLIYLGQYGLEGADWSALATKSSWEFMGLYSLPNSPANYRQIEVEAGESYADWTVSCDLVIAKLGYGVVAESLAYGKPIVFPNRMDFVEHAVLRDHLQGRKMGLEYSIEDFTQLDFLSDIESLLGQDFAPEESRAAEQIGNWLQEGNF